MITRTRLLFCFVLLSIVLGSVENADATPITWTYAGTVKAFPPSVIPAGTSVPFTVTADPAANLAAGSSLPDFMGAYLATVQATMLGVGYTVSSAIEVNGDPVNVVPQPGATSLRELFESTDQGFFYVGNFPTPTIAYIPEDNPNTNAFSPALLMPFPTFNLALFVAPIDGSFPPPPQPSRVDISGQLVPVPEPASGTLAALGFATAALAKRLRRGC